MDKFFQLIGKCFSNQNFIPVPGEKQAWEYIESEKCILGGGTYAKVYKGWSLTQDSRIDVAIKVIKKKDIPPKEQIEPLN